MTGRTWSTDFPTQNPIQPSFRGGDSDAFVVIYAPNGARGFGTYFGGTARDDGLAIAVDGDRSIYFAGSTSSTNFPTVVPVQAVYGGGDIDAYAVRLFPGGSSVAYSTFLGGNLSDSALAIDLLGDTDAYLAGGTRSTNFPLVSPYQAALRGSSEVFISRITDPTPPHEESRTITYTYDPLYRLTAADYDDGTYFHYTYDAVGNRITETTVAGSTVYAYDDANRMTSVGGVQYTWSDNGNLLSDGVYTYAYDRANRLASATWSTLAYGFVYNGLGDRLRQTMNGTPTNYTLDLAGSLTQVLSDGTNAYLYGNARIGEDQPGGWQYHLGDALGSVRQLANASASVTLARSYEPFGDPFATVGTGTSIFQFTGEQRDGTGLVYLRARYYGPPFGRFLSRDVWEGDPNQPMSYNAWLYVQANPPNRTDPTGLWYCTGDERCGQWISDALGRLRSFGWRVAGLMEDFDRRDSWLQARQFAWLWLTPWGETAPEWPPTSGSSCTATGFHFIVSSDLPMHNAEGGEWGMFTAAWGPIYINDDLLERNPPTDFEASLFAHEFVHLLWQGYQTFSIEGELRAAQFQWQLLEDRGYFLPERYEGRTVLELNIYSTQDLELYRRVARYPWYEFRWLP